MHTVTWTHSNLNYGCKLGGGRDAGGGLVATEMEEPDWSILLEIFLSPLSSQLSCSLQAIKCSLFLPPPPPRSLSSSPLLPFSLALCLACIISRSHLWGLFRVTRCPPSSFQQYIFGMVWIAERTLVLKKEDILWPYILSFALWHPKIISDSQKHIWRKLPIVLVPKTLLLGIMDFWIERKLFWTGIGKMKW